MDGSNQAKPLQLGTPERERQPLVTEPAAENRGMSYARLHANRIWACVTRSSFGEGWLYGAGTLNAEVNGARRTLAEAQSAADEQAHPGCDGQGCRPWPAGGTTSAHE